jgi:uncharacterized protein (DUF983 family)
MKRWRAIFRRRCPRCLEGEIYRKFTKSRESCPVCGLVFEREPGYFLGSFYISYGIGAVVGMPMVLVVIYVGLPFQWLIPLVLAWVGLFVPFIVTYARVLWYHFDHVVDPR